MGRRRSVADATGNLQPRSTAMDSRAPVTVGDRPAASAGNRPKPHCSAPIRPEGLRSRGAAEAPAGGASLSGSRLHHARLAPGHRRRAARRTRRAHACLFLRAASAERYCSDCNRPKPQMQPAKAAMLRPHLACPASQPLALQGPQAPAGAASLDGPRKATQRRARTCAAKWLNQNAPTARC